MRKTKFQIAPSFFSKIFVNLLIIILKRSLHLSAVYQTLS